MATVDLRKRVKVYQLDNTGKWEDKGTGFVTCLYIEALGSHCLLVKSEEDGSIILESKVYNHEIYQRQQDTLIVWAEPNTNLDLAISFQDSAGCQDVWDFIILNQRRDDLEMIELPEVVAANLDTIKDFLDPGLSQPVRDRIVNVIIRDDYLKHLLDLFDNLEQANDIQSLHHLFTIFKNLILFNDSSIFELLLSEDYLLRMMGVLEYDPEISEQNRIKHREFLNQQVIFKEVVKFSSDTLISTIHQTFRVQYLKDVVLPRVLDDLTFSTLNSIIYFNNSEIVSQIQKDTSFLQKIFTQIQQSPSGSPERRDLMLFLQELCGLAKNLQIQNKSTFFLSLSSLDLFKTLSTTLDDDVAQTRISTTEIILSTLSHDTRMLRNYITSNSTFLSQLINGFIKDNDIGVKNQIVEIIKVLLEADTTEMNEFFKLFYEKGIYELVSPLSNNQTKENNSSAPLIPGDPSSNLESFVLYNVIELIIYCIKHHSFRIKHFIVNENIAQKILCLTTSNERYMILGSIRFFRCLVSMKDELYNNHMIQDNLFDPIIAIFKQNINKYNLLNSAIIELLQFIYKENIKVLVIYLVERYRELFESITYTDVLSQMILKYEQIKDSYESPEIPCNDNSLLEGSDDAYFNVSDDSDDDRYSTFESSNTNNEEINNSSNMINEGRSDITNIGGNVKIVDYDDDDIDSDEDSNINNIHNNDNNNHLHELDETIAATVCNGSSTKEEEEAEEEEDEEAEEEEEEYTEKPSSSSIDTEESTTTPAATTTTVAISTEEKSPIESDTTTTTSSSTPPSKRTPKRKHLDSDPDSESSENQSFSADKPIQIVFNLNSSSSSNSNNNNNENNNHKEDEQQPKENNNHKSSTLNGEDQQGEEEQEEEEENDEKTNNFKHLKTYHNNDNNEQDNCTLHHLNDTLENGSNIDQLALKRVKIMKDDNTALGVVDQE